MSDLTYEKINFEDKPATTTPVDSSNLNHMDGAIYDIVSHINKSTSYTLSESSWMASGNSIYPYTLTISTTIYDDSDIPICQVWGMDEFETADEITCRAYIQKVIVDSTGITVYATEKPTVDLKLSLKV